METSTERPAKTPMMLLGDIVLTLRFGNSLAMCCWRLWLLSNGSKWKVPKAKSLPTKSLECYNTMQISPNLRRKKSWVKKMMGNKLFLWIPSFCPHSPASKQYLSFQMSSDHIILFLPWPAAIHYKTITMPTPLSISDSKILSQEYPENKGEEKNGTTIMNKIHLNKRISWINALSPICTNRKD